jgi:hypothetical protein
LGFIIRHLVNRGNDISDSRSISYLEALFAVIVWGASFIATKVAMAVPAAELSS